MGAEAKDWRVPSVTVDDAHIFLRSTPLHSSKNKKSTEAGAPSGRWTAANVRSSSHLCKPRLPRGFGAKRRPAAASGVGDIPEYIPPHSIRFRHEAGRLGARGPRGSVGTRCSACLGTGGAVAVRVASALVGIGEGGGRATAVGSGAALVGGGWEVCRLRRPPSRRHRPTQRFRLRLRPCCRHPTRALRDVPKTTATRNDAYFRNKTGPPG